MPGMGRSIRCDARAGDAARRTEIRIEPPLLVLPAMRNERSPGADVAAMPPVPVQMWAAVGPVPVQM